MPFFLVLFLCRQGVAGDAPPWRIAAVVRQGPPPYTDGEGRVYRLEGSANPRFQIGQLLVLSRPGDPVARPGTLKVLSVGPDHVLAHLHEKGNTFPLKGDVCGVEAFSAPISAEQPKIAAPASSLSPVIQAGATPPFLWTQESFGKSLTSMEKLLPVHPQPWVEKKIEAPRFSQEPRHTETLFYGRQSGTLSPAGQAKLKAWVETWGIQGRWVLLLPSAERSEELLQAREKGLRAFLENLGVASIEVRRLPEASSGKYDQAHICFHSPL